MRKFVSISLALFAIVTITWAVKVQPGYVRITQKDGTTLTVSGHGDENMHYYLTKDKVLLCQRGTDFYIAKTDSDGTLSSTGILAHEADNRSEAETAAVNAQDKDAFYSNMDHKVALTRAKSSSVTEAITTSSTLFPHTGSPTALVILADFTDTVFKEKNPKYVFDRYLNADSFDSSDGTLAKNTGSVRKYFKDISGGLFTPNFDVYGPVHLAHPLTYYGGSESDDDGSGENMYALIKDACTAMDDSLDFSKYDQNGDGYVDLLYIIYAGYSQSITGVSNTAIWPKSGTNNTGPYDGVRTYRYGVNNELNSTPAANKTQTLINGIGLFCHEFSHCMGLPDFYPTSSSAQDACNPALEYWDLMDSGEYTNNGYTPNEYSAWEKEAMGWVKIDTLKTATDVTLKPLSEGGTAYRIMNDSDATGHEYYIVENVQKTGWNAAIKGHGMLIYHVDYNANAFSLDWNSVNNTIGHSRMTIFPADGLLISSYDSKYTGAQYQASHSGDPFPGTSNVYSFTDTTSPEKSTVYTGTTKLMGKPITDIAEASDGTITFKFMGGTSGIREAITDHTVNDDNRIFSINGMYMGTDMDVLPKGLYIRNGKKIVK